ncbi:putative ribonuclease H-like domain-containing protein [Tanacetum coccineum]
MTKYLKEHGFFSSVQQRTNHKDFQNCLFAYFLSQEEPKKVIQALKDPSWIEAMQEKLLQFKLQQVYRNKKDERGIVIKNKARLVAQGYTQEEGIDYDEVFAPIARIEVTRLFLAYASFKDFMVYQMDIKSAFLYGKIEKEVYVCQPPGFEDPDFPDRVYKVEKALYGLHQAPRACSMGELTFFLGLQVKQKENGIFISQYKYVIEILKKFGFGDVKTASTPIETHKPLLKDANDEDYVLVKFWATAKAKTINGEVQIQALVDGKKVIVIETSMRRALQLKDAKGIECLPNATIFAELERMGYENLTQKLYSKHFFYINEIRDQYNSAMP